MTAHPGSASDLLLSVEGLGKRYSPIHTRRYTPAESVFSRFFGRGDALLADLRAGSGDVGAEDDDDDDDDDEDEEEEGADVDVESETKADFEGLSFRLARGEAIGIVASPPPAARMVAYVLGGMTSPSAGRAVVQGRVGPTVRLANTFIRREPTPQRAAVTLARLMGISLADRSTYVEEVLRLALSDGESLRALPAGRLLRRVAVAAAIDPFADLLVIDELPAIGSSEFRQRCIERLAERLAAGAAAVIATNDPRLVRRLCRECVWIDHGRPTPAGPSDDVLAAYESGANLPRPRSHGFNQFGAILSARARPDTAEVHVELEIGARNVAIAPRLILIDEDGDEHEPPKPRAFNVPPGRIDLDAVVGPGAAAAGVYSLRVSIDIVVGGTHSTITREVAGLLDMSGDGGAPGEAVTWSYEEAPAGAPAE